MQEKQGDYPRASGLTSSSCNPKSGEMKATEGIKGRSTGLWGNYGYGQEKGGKKNHPPYFCFNGTHKFIRIVTFTLMGISLSKIERKDVKFFEKYS